MTTINNMGIKFRPYVLFIIIMGLSACSATQVHHEVELPAGGSSLDNWLENTLNPYLIQQLSQHPRFKSQPILLVGMGGEEVRSRVDDLTAEIRAKIGDALLKQPGLDLAWQPTGPPREHHQSLADVSCGIYRKVQYYIGLDCGLTRLEGKLYVKVRALNLDEQKWVTGFGKSWEGRPTAAQLAALAREHPDEYLRGRRPLPFSEEQPDLLAAYLARNLSCVLRQAESDDLVVHVAKASADSPAVFKTALELVGKYLARFREVEVTDDPNQANITLIGEMHAIHQSLHQIWVSARYRRDEKYLPGAETEAYVLIDAHERMQVAGGQIARPYAPLPSSQRLSNPSELIASFDLLTPMDQNSCSTGAPWQSGVRRIDPRGRIPGGGCLAVEMTLSAAAYVFLVGQDAGGELTQMFPSVCTGLQKNDALLHPGQLFQFPSLSDPNAGVLEVTGSPGRERVFAIAITSPDLADRFADRLEDVQDLCRPGKRLTDNLMAANARLSAEHIYQWQDFLIRFSADNPGLVQWQAISFWHEP
jgi:hypothetical protein